MTSIELFKTNIDDTGAAEYLIGLLQQRFPYCRITIDLHDCDKVLRLEGMRIENRLVKELVNGNGFLCNELD